MSPDVTTFHLRNQAATDSEIGCDRAASLACLATVANLKHQRVGKFRHAIAFAATVKHHAGLLWAASFRVPVNSIVTSGTSKEMGRIAARSIVTPVENKGQLVRYLSVVRQRISNAVRSGDGAILAGTRIESAVPLVAYQALPFPAGIRAAAHINARPKAIELFRGKIDTHVRVPSDVPCRGRYSAARLSVLSPQLYQMVAS